MPVNLQPRNSLQQEPLNDQMADSQGSNDQQQMYCPIFKPTIKASESDLNELLKT